jgi:Flp pilus assembly pilin Flp
MKGLISRFWQEEDAQGTTEYILIVLVVVALAFVFRDRIRETVESKINELSGKIGEF